MLGIPPLTFIFMPLMVITLLKHRAKRIKRAQRLKAAKTVNESFIGSWF
jgi:hypothetical protein